jgi:hypothetical protein
MTSFLERLGTAVIDAAVTESINEMHRMVNLQHEGGDEILANIAKKGLDFCKECKYTLTEKNGSTLDVIISHPKMEDLKYKNLQNSSSITQDIFIPFIKYARIMGMANPSINSAEYTRGKNNYSRIIAYLDKRLYNSIKNKKSE